MAEKASKREMFIGKRVRALALMYLTRRDDLRVEEARDDAGLDLIVQFMPADKEGVRQFGVVTRGAWSSVTKDQADKLLGRSAWEAQQYGPFAFPVCEFFFAMEGNDGWFTWVAEPFIHVGKAQLQMRAAADCERLDKKTVDEIVSRVDHWYDAFYDNLVTTAVNGGKPGRRPAKH